MSALRLQVSTQSSPKAGVQHALLDQVPPTSEAQHVDNPVNPLVKQPIQITATITSQGTGFERILEEASSRNRFDTKNIDILTSLPPKLAEMKETNIETPTDFSLSMASKASTSLLAASVRSYRYKSRKCLSHNPQKSRRAYSTIHEVESPVEVSEISSHADQRYLIQTAILLNRSPTLSHPPSSFETAYYEYNAKIGRALFNPFPYQFYFKSGSVLKGQFNKEERLRDKEAFNWGKKPRRGKHNAELKSSNTTRPAKDSSTEVTEEQNKMPRPFDEAPKIRSGGSTIAISGMMAKEEEEEIMPRVTDADLRKDVKSLDRKGHRNLYLLIKRGKGLADWTLPGAQGGLRDGELLHEAAERELYADCGVNIDAWIVGRHPIGYMDDQLPPNLLSTGQYVGCKTFFFKAHVMAGQVDPSTGSFADFAWMTKNEVKQAVKPEYWTGIRDIMSDF